MLCYGTVVHCDKFSRKKDGKEFTKLYVPVTGGVAEVVTSGDLTALQGVSDVPFSLVLRDNQLKLYYEGEEE